MTRRGRKNEEGALLIILMVGVAVTMIGLAVAFQQWSTVWRRDNEEELIFRGEQYVIALKAYQKEHARQLPMNLEDLMKPGPRQVRYIRKLFRDPMKKDAKWGLLYLMPQGNAIYDPVAAQKGQKQKEKAGGSSWVTAGTTDADLNSGLMGTPGVYPISDPSGAGIMGGPGGPQAGMQPGGIQPGGMQQQGGMQAGLQNRLRGGGFSGVAAQVSMGSLPPPREDADEESVSETPIGWPIAGVISRVVDMEGMSPGSEGQKEGEVPTFKIFRGKEHADEWQFHIGAQGNDLAQGPQGTLPGGTPAPFLGPGFGGQGPIGGMGNGARPNFGAPGFGGNGPVGGGGRMQGGGMQNQGGAPQAPWYPGGRNPNGGN